MTAWRWVRTSDNEPLTMLRVDHYLSREDIVMLLCAGTTETGARLTHQDVLAAVRSTLASAWQAGDSLEMWAETRGGSSAEVDARIKWAQALAARL